MVNRIRISTLVVVLCFFAAVTQAQSLNGIVEAERAFARMSTAKGIKESFLANLADHGIIFRPAAVRGKEWMQNNPTSTSQLSWEPEFADIAATGDLGYTTGPWEIRRTPADAPAGFGHYVTLWRKQQDGSWKVALDTGISHDAGPKPTSVASPATTVGTQKARRNSEIQTAAAALRLAERRFPDTTETYASALTAGARVYRNDHLPLVGPNAFRPVLAAVKGTYIWNMQNVGISNSADFAYSYGTVEFNPADKSKPSEMSNFVRIWKTQGNGTWKVVLDVMF